MLNWICCLSFLWLMPAGASAHPNPPKEVLKLINAQRSRGCKCGKTFYPPQAPLVWNETIARAAESHAQYLATTNQLSHRDNKGDMARDRLAKVGYQYQSYAENIAEGFFLAEDVVKAWIESPTHCRNLMGEYTETAIGYSGGFWVQNFGTPRKQDQ